MKEMSCFFLILWDNPDGNPELKPGDLTCGGARLCRLSANIKRFIPHNAS